MKTSTQLKLIGRRTFALVLLLAGLLALVGARDANAAGAIVVNSTADVAADDGLCTLREAITAANYNTASGATAGECAAGVWVDVDTITFSVSGTITLGSELPAITASTTIDGAGQEIIISGNDSEDWVIYIELYSSRDLVTLNELTITRGHGSGILIIGYGSSDYGAGSVTVTNSTISDNFTAGYGGGVLSSGVRLTIDNSTVSGNTARIDGSDYAEGGGLHFSGSDNPSAVARVTNTLFSDNVAYRGGAIYSSYGDLVVSGSTFSGNSAAWAGGGIRSLGGSMNVNNSTFYGNDAQIGGGMAPYITQTTVTHSTFSNNRAQAGSAIHAQDGFPIVKNSLFTTNITGFSTLSTCWEASTDASNIADDNTCNSSTVKSASAIALGPLADNGGPTPTMALGPSSAAIDAGNNLHATTAGLSTDQRGTGFVRVYGGTVDVGAFEVQPETIVCQPGSYDSGSSCVPADPGHYVAESGATAQTDCALGTYQTDSGATSCDAASPGHYVDVTAAAAEIACVPGYYQPDGGAVSCIAASPGSYVPQSAATEQLPCPAGTTSAAAATTCTPAGYAFSGFFQPIDNLPLVNSVKAGAAVPVKFSLSGNQGLNILAAGYPGSARITCDTAAPIDDVEQTATAGSSGLSYDPATDVYTYVWKTNKSWAGTCRLLTVKLVDGTEHQAAFQFKR